MPAWCGYAIHAGTHHLPRTPPCFIYMRPKPLQSTRELHGLLLGIEKFFNEGGRGGGSGEIPAIPGKWRGLGDVAIGADKKNAGRGEHPGPQANVRAEQPQKRTKAPEKGCAADPRRPRDLKASGKISGLPRAVRSAPSRANPNHAIPCHPLTLARHGSGTPVTPPIGSFFAIAMIHLPPHPGGITSSGQRAPRRTRAARRYTGLAPMPPARLPAILRRLRRHDRAPATWRFPRRIPEP